LLNSPDSEPLATGRSARRPSTNHRPVSLPASDVGGNSRLIGGMRIFDPDDPLPKSRLSEKSLRYFANLLLAKRRELVGDVEHMTFEALVGHNPSSGRSHMPQHMADIGSDAWEQEFTLGLLENERTLVREIDEALLRIRDGTYGVCQATHRPISRARLAAKPWARYCIEYARMKEQGRVS